jgi:hypothetical protein
MGGTYDVGGGQANDLSKRQTPGSRKCHSIDTLKSAMCD